MGTRFGSKESLVAQTTEFRDKKAMVVLDLHFLLDIVDGVRSGTRGGTRAELRIDFN